MPSRVLVVLDGTTYVQHITPDHRLRDLQAACNYLLTLIEAERVKAGHGHG